MGHRLMRHAAATYLGRQIGFATRGYWSGNDYGNNTRDIFSEMFEPYTREDFPFVNSTKRVLKVVNEVPFHTGIKQKCFWGNARGQCTQTNTRGKEGPDCSCTFDELEVHTSLFRSLRDRYVRRKQLEDFMKKHKFADHTVFGMHIRAGNGEKAAFSGRGRSIKHDPNDYISSLITEMQKSIPIDTLEKPPMIFMATDDPKYRGIISTEIEKMGLSWPVVVLEQEFLEKGTLADGRSNHFEMFHSMFQDMLLLSYSDVVIPIRYSSFPQAMPMYLALDRPESERKLRDTYCEVVDANEKGTKPNVTGPQLSVFCYHSLMQLFCGTDNPVHRKVMKCLDPEYRYNQKPFDLEIQDFGPTQYLSFEDGLGYKSK